MKKISVMLCAFVACLFTACDTCGYDQGKPKTIYTWTYTNNGTTSSGEFETDEYGQAGFDVPAGTDCSKVDVKVKGDGGNALPVSSPEN